VANFGAKKIEFAKFFKPVEWVVRDICLISRVDDKPFEIKFSIPLSDGSSLNLNELTLPVTSIPSPVLFQIDQLKNIETSLVRITKWIKNSLRKDESKLPRSRRALANSISKMCIVSVNITTEQYVYDILMLEGFILEIGEEINYLKTPESLRDHKSTTIDSKELRDCLSNVRGWIVQKHNNPKTKAALFKCLSYLVVTKVLVDTSEVIDQLVEKKSPEIHKRRR